VQCIAAFTKSALGLALLVLLLVISVHPALGQVIDGQLIQTPDGALYVVQDGQLHAIDPVPTEFQQLLGVPVGAPVVTGVQIIGAGLAASPAPPVVAPPAVAPPAAVPAPAAPTVYVDERGQVTTATAGFDAMLRSPEFAPAESRLQLCREVTGQFNQGGDVWIQLVAAGNVPNAGSWDVRTSGAQCATVAVQPGVFYHVRVDTLGFVGQWQVTVRTAP
jgi:hypothetical protein